MGSSTLATRLDKAMRDAGEITNAELARRLTELLHKRKELPPGKVVSPEVVRSVRTGRQDTSVYVVHFAKLLNVSAMWLALDEGDARPTPVAVGPAVSLVPPDEIEGHTEPVRTVHIKQRHKALLESYLTLPRDIRLPIRAHVENLASAIREGYLRFERERATASTLRRKRQSETE